MIRKDILDSIHQAGSGPQQEKLARLLLSTLDQAEGLGFEDLKARPAPVEREKPKDLRQQTYELLKIIREPSPEERKTLEGRGFIFLPVRRLSYAQVVAKNEKYFLDGELKYANERPDLRDYVFPVAVELGFNLKELALNGSFNSSQALQLSVIDERSQSFQVEFPSARLVMLPVTAYAQADLACKIQTGQVLIKDFFARGLDMLSGVYAASAGRRDPARPFHVNVWSARKGDPSVGAVPAVVFVGNK